MAPAAAKERQAQRAVCRCVSGGFREGETLPETRPIRAQGESVYGVKCDSGTLAGGGHTAVTRQLQLGIAVEDAPVELNGRLGRLDAELVAESPDAALVGAQCEGPVLLPGVGQHH